MWHGSLAGGPGFAPALVKRYAMASAVGIATVAQAATNLALGYGAEVGGQSGNICR